MEIWLFNIGYSGSTYLCNVPISSGKITNTYFPAPPGKALGIAGKSPEGNEDLQRIARSKKRPKAAGHPARTLIRIKGAYSLPQNLFPKVRIQRVKGKFIFPVIPLGILEVRILGIYVNGGRFYTTTGLYREDFAFCCTRVQDIICDFVFSLYRKVDGSTLLKGNGDICAQLIKARGMFQRNR